MSHHICTNRTDIELMDSDLFEPLTLNQLLDEELSSQDEVEHDNAFEIPDLEGQFKNPKTSLAIRNLSTRAGQAVEQRNANL